MEYILRSVNLNLCSYSPVQLDVVKQLGITNSGCNTSLGCFDFPNIVSAEQQYGCSLAALFLSNDSFTEYI